jgi:hypothetical protein
MTFDKLEDHIRQKLPLTGYFVFTPHELETIQDFMCKPHYESNQDRMVTLLEAKLGDANSDGIIKDDIQPTQFFD